MSGTLLVRRISREVRDYLRYGIAEPPPLSGMTLDDDDVAIATEWLFRDDISGNQDLVTSYEHAFSSWNGSTHAFAYMSGREALSAGITALNLPPGGEVILPAYTCVVVANAVRFAGLTPRFVDIELDTFGPDATAVTDSLTPQTVALVIQHTYGLVCRDYARLLEIGRSRGLRIVEDCAHSTGAMFQGRRVGTRGDLGIYSSELSKAFCTVRGGLVVTDLPEIADRLREQASRAAQPGDIETRRLLHNVLLYHGVNKCYQHRWQGYRSLLRHGHYRFSSTTAEEEQGIKPASYGMRMPPAVAALGLNQLRKLDSYNERRREAARRWAAWCSQQGYTVPRTAEFSVPIFLRFPVLVSPERKADLSWAMRDLGVRPGVWFQGALHPLRETMRGCPNSAVAVAQCINLPCLGV